MWLLIWNGGLGVDRRIWSPMCGALFAALLLDSDAALAGDELRGTSGADGSAALLVPVIPPSSDGPAPLATPELPPALALPAGIAPAPGSAPAPLAASHDALDDQRPIRLNARAVLSLNDLFLEPWHGVSPPADAPLFSSSGPRIRRLELGGLEKESGEPTQIRRSFSASEVHSGWLGDHVELSFNDGISYKESFRWRGTNLRLKIWGPMLKGDPGLGMRLRGFQWNGHPVEVRARATTKIQDLQVKIDF
jgi:hypothetical protein